MEKIKLGLSLLAVTFLVYIFTFYVDGEMGIILISFVVIAPLISLALAVYARKNIKLTFDCDAYVPKGKKLKIRVKAEKKGVIPFGIIEIKPYMSEVFAENVKVYRFSMLKEEIKEFVIEADAQVGGNGEIGIESAWSCDFLGFFRLKLKTGIQPNILVGVIPEIPDVKASSELVRSIANVVATSENDEDNDTSMMFSSNTTPGYEHREYVQGDPLKRVNWKLSSKKSVLMVRLDEAAASVQPVVILDLYRNEKSEPKNSIRLEERIICAVFGFISALIKQGIACNFIFKGNTGDAVSESIDDPDYIEQVLLKVLAVKVEKGQRLDVRRFSDSVCACVAATTDAGEGFSAVLDAVGECESVTLIGDSVRTVNKTSYPLWFLDDDNNFKLV